MSCSVYKKACFLIAYSVLSFFCPSVHALFSSAAKSASSSSSVETYRLLNLFGDAFARVRQEYVEPISDQKLIENALSGMLSSLDPHSGYLTEKDYKELNSRVDGVFGGLGMEVIGEHGVVKVISPLDDTPAFKAGIQPGDYVVEIDGKSVVGLTLNETVDKMRGEPGTEVTLKLVREGQEPLTKILKRELIKVKPVRWKLMDGVGYIRVSTFLDAKTDEKVAAAVQAIKDEAGEDLKGFVLDLRNNAGGLLEQAVDVSGLFLGDNKEIVSIKGRNNMTPRRFFSEHKNDITNDLPIVVLINSGSASAPEIMAGALKDHNRAVVMGARSFGKGSVQTVFPMHGKGAMVVTTDLYYTPSGQVIQAQGVEPHIAVEPAIIEPLETGLFREEDLPKALLTQFKDSQKNKGSQKKPRESSKNVSEEGKEQQGEKAKTSNKMPNLFALKDRESKDYQIQRAIDLVKGMSIVQQLDAEQASGEEQKGA